MFVLICAWKHDTINPNDYFHRRKFLYLSGLHTTATHHRRVKVSRVKESRQEVNHHVCDTTFVDTMNLRVVLKVTSVGL